MIYPQTSRLFMLAVLFAALMLAGCGGGSDGTANALRTDIEMLEEDFR